MRLHNLGVVVLTNSKQNEENLSQVNCLLCFSIKVILLLSILIGQQHVVEHAEHNKAQKK